MKIENCSTKTLAKASLEALDAVLKLRAVARTTQKPVGGVVFVVDKAVENLMDVAMEANRLTRPSLLNRPERSDWYVFCPNELVSDRDDVQRLMRHIRNTKGIVTFGVADFIEAKTEWAFK